MTKILVAFLENSTNLYCLWGSGILGKILLIVYLCINSYLIGAIVCKPSFFNLKKKKSQGNSKTQDVEVRYLLESIQNVSNLIYYNLSTGDKIIFPSIWNV